MTENPHQFDDTQPVVTVRTPDTAAPARAGILGWVLLGGALLITLVAVGLLLNGNSTPTPDVQIAQSLPTVTALPLEVVPQIPTSETIAVVQQQTSDLPALDAAQRATLLQTPVAALTVADRGNLLKYNPFTFIPERARSEFVQYTAVSGDTVDLVAQRYNLKPESLAWCNDRRIIFVLRPGDILNIPPVDGACHVTLGTRQETIASIAAQYKVSTQNLLNSPFGTYYDMSPDSVLEGGRNVFIPDGQGELITWNPPSEVTKDDAGNVLSVAFAKGQAGSCGAVEPGGGAAWGNPLPNGTWVRGFSVGHTGIDLSAATGTPIYAANSGPVLFSGFSSWGYGEMVALAHGPFSTLYGHMSARYATCGQYINVGQVVGLVGSTGNSSGSHLHFEIRSNDEPQNPSGTPGIGW